MLLMRRTLRLMLSMVATIAVSVVSVFAMPSSEPLISTPQAKGATNSIAKIAGSLAESDGGRVVFSYGDVYLGEQQYVAQVDEGRFEAELPLEALTEVEIFRGNKLLAQVLIAPDESVEIEHIDSTPRFSGSAARRNEELRNYLNDMRFDSFTPSYTTTSADKFVDVLKRNIEIERSKMESALSESSESLRRWAESEIIYRNGLYAVEYARRNNLKDSSSLAQLYDTRLFPIDSAGRIAMDYCRYLSAVVRDQYIEANPVAANYLLRHDRAGAYAAALAQLAKVDASVTTREIVGGAIYGVAYNANYQTFVSLLEQTHDCQYVSDRMISWLDDLRVARGERADMRRFTEHSFERLLAESHREVIYVDVWATWCPPCLREMKHLRRMERRLEGRGVKFVSLCVSSPYIQWMLTVDQPENRSANYWLDDEAQVVLDRYIRIRSFPRFFVLSGGKIINENVQWPSSNDLIDGILGGYVEELARENSQRISETDKLQNAVNE